MKFESLKLKKFAKLRQNEMRYVKGGWTSQGSRAYWCQNSFFDGVHCFIRDIDDDGNHLSYGPTVRNDGQSTSYGDCASGTTILAQSSNS